MHGSSSAVAAEPLPTTVRYDPSVPENNVRDRASYDALEQARFSPELDPDSGHVYVEYRLRSEAGDTFTGRGGFNYLPRGRRDTFSVTLEEKVWVYDAEGGAHKLGWIGLPPEQGRKLKTIVERLETQYECEERERDLFFEVRRDLYGYDFSSRVTTPYTLVTEKTLYSDEEQERLTHLVAEYGVSARVRDGKPVRLNNFAGLCEGERVHLSTLLSLAENSD